MGLGKVGRFLVAYRWRAAIISAAIVTMLIWVVWPAAEDEPRARVYLEFSACLLIAEKGEADPDVARVAEGLREASLATRAKVQVVPVLGPQTTDNAVTFVNSLVQRRCDLIFAAGPLAVGAVGRTAGAWPQVRFFVVGDSMSASNVTVVAGDVRAEARRILIEAVQSSPR